jgi:hypothetical protein
MQLLNFFTVSNECETPDILVMDSKASTSKAAEAMVHDISHSMENFYMVKKKIKPLSWMFDFVESYNGNTYFM